MNTTVNNHKKNRVAFGFKALVKNHCFIATPLDIVVHTSHTEISIIQLVENKLWIPIQIKYTAQHHLIRVKSKIDCDIISANHSRQYVMCTIIHHQNHKAVQYQISLP